MSTKSLKILLPLVVVGLGAATAVLLVRSAPRAETVEPSTPPPLVRVVAAAPRPARLDVTSQGTVGPRIQATLTAQVAGRVVAVDPDFAAGGSFRAGEVLVRIDPTDYRLAVSQAEGEVARARTRLIREEAEAAVARAEWRELGSGEPDPLALREPQLAEARSALQAATARLEQARANLERTTVEAPFTGRVAEQQVDVGQAVIPGTPLGRVFATAYAEVELPVPVAELEFLDVDLTGAMADGPRVELSADLAGAERRWPARIVRTAGSIDRQTRMLGLIARVEEPYGAAARAAGAALPMGLFVDAVIAGRSAEGVYVLPRAALRDGDRLLVVEDAREPDPSGAAEAGSGGEDRDGAGSRAGAEPAGRLRFRAVELLRLAGDDAVVEAGLSPGDLVVVSPLDTPVDGMTVRFTEDRP